MNETAVASIIEDLNNQGVFNRTDFTFTEYVDALKGFQSFVARMVFGDDVAEDVRMNEVIAKIETMAREQGKVYDQDVFHGINALKLIQKEIAVAMAGKKGEDRVAKTFQYVSRPDAHFYRNMYISNGSEETEMDVVVLTKNGVIILEIKNAKEDITIAPDGRILFNNSSCYHDTSIGEKMEKKIRLLKVRLKEELLYHGIDTELVVEGLLVFSTPNGVRIHVNNQFHQINYCFRGNLFNRIDSFESEIEYSSSDIDTISAILESIETAQKRFEVKFDPADVKEKFARAIVALTYVPQEEQTVAIKADKTSDSVVADISDTNDKHKNGIHHKKAIKQLLGVACAGTAVACCAVIPLVFASVGRGIDRGTLFKVIRG